VLNELRQRYPGLSMISSSITNKQLAEAGMSCAVTVYGTVAHEMACFGIPIIACAHHPHISFDFCRTAQSRDEYANYLRDFTRFPIDKVAMHRQSLMFYYMHNLNSDEETKSLRDAAMEFRKACEKSNGQNDLTKVLRKIVALPGYASTICRLAREHNVSAH
jgi:hypothetical protein